MNRGAFIDQYMARSGISSHLRTKRGCRRVAGPEYALRAVPCWCGSDRCLGWAMVNAAEWPEEVRWQRAHR